MKDKDARREIKDLSKYALAVKAEVNSLTERVAVLERLYSAKKLVGKRTELLTKRE